MSAKKPVFATNLTFGRQKFGGKFDFQWGRDLNFLSLLRCPLSLPSLTAKSQPFFLSFYLSKNPPPHLLFLSLKKPPYSVLYGSSLASIRGSWPLPRQAASQISLMVDVICYLCKDENLSSPSSALKSPVSVLLPKLPGLVRHVEPSCRYGSLSLSLSLSLSPLPCSSPSSIYKGIHDVGHSICKNWVCVLKLFIGKLMIGTGYKPLMIYLKLSDLRAHHCFILFLFVGLYFHAICVYLKLHSILFLG